MTPVKGHDVLVEALALLGEVSWTCRIVGSLEVDPAHAATVTAAYVQQGMAPRFTWTGALPRRAMTGEYAAADLVVVPSRHESYGMVAAEALAAGVPVVASDVGGLREALSTGPDACLFVPPDEPEALAAALCAWLTDPRSGSGCAWPPGRPG
ncbi:glycosyltransferase family 4 protein [Nocardioides sp.]|uniref:glycosyltransferase family 4 protein n=1 Tax=Nocardioides sp. TaxID=35761 RepID=UPI00352970BF